MGAERFATVRIDSGRRLVDPVGAGLRADEIGREGETRRTGRPQPGGGVFDAGRTVERGRHDRHGEPGGEKDGCGLRGLDCLGPSRSGDDDTVGRGDHAEQQGAVGPRETRLRQSLVQRRGEQRMGPERGGNGDGGIPARRGRSAQLGIVVRVRSGEDRNQHRRWKFRMSALAELVDHLRQALLGAVQVNRADGRSLITGGGELRCLGRDGGRQFRGARRGRAGDAEHERRRVGRKGNGVEAAVASPPT